MISAKLVTLKGEWTGDCEIKGDSFLLSIDSPSPIPFKYGVLILSNSSVPIPVMAKQPTFSENKVSVTCWRVTDPNGNVYKPSFFSGELHYRLHRQVLEMFAKHGAAEAKVIDTILVCPECEGTAYTIRPGCPSCGSHSIRPDQLIHHYACGNVDLMEKFTINRERGSISCGKCGKDRLIINVDYDVSVGLQRCMECGWTGNGAKLIGRCSCCDISFLITEAKEAQLIEYTML
jgi:hypothetical protein